MPSAEYMREWRKRNTEAYARVKEKDAALGRAYRRLGKMYPAELGALYAEEQARAQAGRASA